MPSIIEIRDLSHTYPAKGRNQGPREALCGINLTLEKGEILGLLGPNGGGKTTLFRVLSTAMMPSSGSVSVCGVEIKGNVQSIRKQMGVVFQYPSLDRKLRVFENLIHQGHLYGMRGPALVKRGEFLLDKFNLLDRKHEMVETLSGGLQRRVELAKGLLHKPSLLLMDEPSTGLDPGARRELWSYLKRLRDDDNTSILLTTHIMEEAEECDRIGIIDHGKLVALGTPETLKEEVGGDVISIRTGTPEQLRGKIEERFACEAMVLDGTVRIEQDQGQGLPGAGRMIAQLIEAYPEEIESVTVAKPTLEDVFIHKTGHLFQEEESEL